VKAKSTPESMLGLSLAASRFSSLSHGLGGQAARSALSVGAVCGLIKVKNPGRACGD
jgi:hypothetical protein